MASHLPGVPFQVADAGSAIVVADADPATWGGSRLADVTRLGGRVWGLAPETGDVLWTVDTSASEAFVATSGDAVAISTSDTRAGARTETIVVDGTTGDQLWDAPTDPASSPPVVSGSAVYVATTTGKLLAFDLARGHELWTTTSGTGANYTFPALIGNTIVAPSDADTLDARDPSTGSRLWTSTIAACPSRPFGPSQPFETGNHLFVLRCGGLYAVGAAGEAATPWLIPQGGFQWVKPIPHGVLGSTYTGEGPVGLMALGVD